MWTLLSLLTWTTEYFNKHSIPTPRLDAEVLLSFSLGIERIQLYLQFERLINKEELASFKAIIQRRVKGEPVSYIRGLKEFWSLPFKVGPGVMIPRPDTEVLVEAIVRGSGFDVREESIQILEIGTGSGNIAIALAKNLEKSKITAIDISEEALKYARENAKAHGVSEKIDFKNLNFLTSDMKCAPSPYHLMVSNPPYIPSEKVLALPSGIKDYEPSLALDGGVEGLDFYYKMGECVGLIKEGGMVAVEIGEEQGEEVTKIFQKAGLKDVKVIPDYAGLPRVVIGYR